MFRKVLTPEDIVYMDECVKEWNEVGGLSFDTSHENNSNFIETYTNLCKEEGQEAVEAIEEGDLSEELDALGDSVFTGFALNRLFTGTGFEEEYNWLQEIYSEINSYRDLEWKYLLEYLDNNDVHGYTSNLLVKLFIVSEKFDILGAFNRIKESNFSKFVHVSGKIDLEEEFQKIEAEGRYGELFTERVGEYLVFKARKDLKEDKFYPQGKIIKPSSFKSVEDLGGLEEFVY